MAPPVGPTPRPDVHPLPPGTHLLFTQSGRIEHVPLDGYAMEKEGAKAVLHLPVSLPKEIQPLHSLFVVSNGSVVPDVEVVTNKEQNALSRPEYSHFLVVISGR